MLPNPLPEGRPTKLTSEWLNKLVALGRELAGLTVSPPLTLRRTGGQTVIGMNPIPTIDLIEITGPQNPAGWYPAEVKLIDTSTGVPVYQTLETTKVWVL